MGDDTTVSMMRTLLAAVCFLAGCNQLLGIDDVTGGSGSPSIDAPPGTPDTPLPTADARFAGPIAFTTASDFNHAGMAGALELSTGAVTMDAAPGQVGRDPVVRFAGGFFAIVNRYGDNGVVLLDPGSLAPVHTFSTGAGTNPQDIAIANGKAFVPTLGSAGVQVFDLAGNGQARLVDLSGFDSDGKPDCESAYTATNHVFVACGLLDATFKPRGPGKIAVIDPATEGVTTSFDLPFANPIGFLAPTVGSGAGGELLIETVPTFSDLTMGCIARIKTTGTPAANGCLVGNAMLGGYVTGMTIDATGNTVDATNSAGTLLLIGYPGGSVATFAPPTNFLFVDVAGCSTGDLALTLVPKTTGIGDGGFQLLHAGVLAYPGAKSIGIGPENADALACN